MSEPPDRAADPSDDVPSPDLPVSTPEEALEEVFGYPSFRPSQRDVIGKVVDGDDVLAIMPTGSGKSLCFQLPACLTETGTVLVVSPLIALMQDQLEGLEAVGLPATLINSSLSRRERRRRIDAMARGTYRLVYVAPERFRSDRFREAIESTDVSLLAIDEAHCISQWGHDFRPDYLALEEAREMLGSPPVLAVTATATKQVQKDILDQLGLDEADVVVGGFERPNLYFDVRRATGKRDKIDQLVDLLERAPSESSVVYCATRRQVERVADELDAEDFVCGAYHAGMSDQKRRVTQEAFMAGDLPVLVATNAFGMGVDKPDIRSIVHYNIPGSLEAYYQEAGRAGRDGEPAHCSMLYDPADRDIHDFFIENSYPKKTTIQAIWRELRGHGTGRHEIGPEQLAENLESSSLGPDRLHEWAVESSLELLKRGGHLDFGYRGGRPWVEVHDRVQIRQLRVDWESLERQREVEERQLEDVVTYASGQRCRKDHLIRYFGATPDFGNECDTCDVCDEDGVPTFERVGASPSDDPETVVRKMLSGVARTHDEATELDVAAMLRGSPSDRYALDVRVPRGCLSARPRARHSSMSGE